MNARVEVEEVPMHGDARGWVVEPLDEAGLRGQRNVHVAFTEPGCLRGNHAHAHTTEVLLVAGPARVRWQEQATVRELDVAEGRAVRFTFPPGVAHVIKNTGTRPNVLVSFNDHPHDRAHPDTVPVRLMEA